MANAIPTDLKDRNRVAIVTGQKVKMYYNGEKIEGIYAWGIYIPSVACDSLARNCFT